MEKESKQFIPLSDKMRPHTLEDFFGQEQVVGQSSFLKTAIEKDSLPSLILWGPPGCGKTTLANIIATQTNSAFLSLSAVGSGVKELRIVIAKAEINKTKSKRTILFIDEIHRWNKSQQDALLPHVEKGTITLMGATTENPSFEVNSALLSRARVFVLNRLKGQDIASILVRAIRDKEYGLGSINIEIEKEGIALIARLANGDARSALNIIEACASQTEEITTNLIKDVVQKSHLYYDKDGEEHYNIISALHKSIRGGDAHAGVYWLARMLEAGEDPIYIARRLLRFAAEDIGNINPQATILANAVFDTCKKLGMPECDVHLSQLVMYLAESEKSIVCYKAIKEAKKDVKTHGNLPVPMHLRNAPTKLMKNLGYGKDYKYTPLEDSSEQNYFPKKLFGKKYYE